RQKHSHNYIHTHTHTHTHGSTHTPIHTHTQILSVHPLQQQGTPQLTKSGAQHFTLLTHPMDPHTHTHTHTHTHLYTYTTETHISTTRHMWVSTLRSPLSLYGDTHTHTHTHPHTHTHTHKATAQ